MQKSENDHKQSPVPQRAELQQNLKAEPTRLNDNQQLNSDDKICFDFRNKSRGFQEIHVRKSSQSSFGIDSQQSVCSRVQMPQQTITQNNSESIIEEPTESGGEAAEKTRSKVQVNDRQFNSSKNSSEKSGAKSPLITSSQIQLRRKQSANEEAVGPGSFYVSTSSNPYPSLDLKAGKSSTAGTPIAIKIIDYESQFFLKVETQVFRIKVLMNEDSTGDKGDLEAEKSDYTVQRRFSDFWFLHKAILTNHLGFIVPPFPEKSVESFLKIKLSLGQQEQKHTLIEKRLFELQSFVNALLKHSQLRFSEELGVFLVEDTELFQKGRSRIEKYVAEYEQLCKCLSILENGFELKRTLHSGVSIVKNWVKSDLESPQKQPSPSSTDSGNPSSDQSFSTKEQQVEGMLQQFLRLAELLDSIVKVNQQFVHFQTMKTDLDALLRLSSKISSGRQFSSQLIQKLSNQSFEEVLYHQRYSEQVLKQFQQRTNIWRLISESQANDENKREKLKRRLQRFDNNFSSGFSEFMKSSQQCYSECKAKIDSCWKSHCANMKKIWK